MRRVRHRLPWWPAPVAVGLVAAAIAGWHVTRPAIWRDEAASITAAQRDWPAFAGLIAHVDVVHATYYALLHLWFDLVGYTPLTLRLPSVLAAAVAAALVAVLGRRLAGGATGIAAGCAAAVLPSLVWAGGEGRSYALTALWGTGATLAFVHALRPQRSRARFVGAWAGYAALLGLGTLLFLDDLLLGAAHVVSALLLGGRRNRFAALIAALAGAAAASPLIVAAIGQTGQVDWIVDYGRTLTVQDAVVGQWFRADAVAIVWAAVLAVGLVVAALRRRLPGRVLAIALPWALLPPAALAAVGLVHAPVYWPRYVTFTAPAVALLTGAVAAALWRPLTAAAIVLLAAVAVPQIRADRLPRAKADSEMQLAARLVARERSPADGPSGIVFGQYDAIEGVTTRVEAIAYPAAFTGLRDLTAVGPLADSTELFGADISTEAAVPRMRHLRTVWILLDLDSSPKTHVPAASMEALGFTETGRSSTPGSLLLKWTR